MSSTNEDFFHPPNHIKVLMDIRSGCGAQLITFLIIHFKIKINYSNYTCRKVSSSLLISSSSCPFCAYNRSADMIQSWQNPKK